MVVKLGHAPCYSSVVDAFSKTNAKQRPSLGSGEEWMIEMVGLNQRSRVLSIPLCLESWSQLKDLQTFLILSLSSIMSEFRDLWVSPNLSVFQIGVQNCCRWLLTQGSKMCMRINCSVLVLDIAWDWHWELVCHNCMQVLLYFPDVCLMEDGSQPSTIANPNSHKHDIASSSPPSLKSNHPWPIRNLKDFQELKSSHTHQVRYFQHSAWWLIWLWVKIITPMVQQVNFVAVWLVIDLIRSEDHHSHPPTSELRGCMMVPTYSRIRF